jgi:hypothetical protein
MPSVYVPKPKTKMMKCRNCDGMIEVGWKTKKAPSHLECSISLMIEVQRQLHERSGPHYAAWREAMRRTFAD